MPESLLKLHSLLFDEKLVRMGYKGNEITVSFISSQFILEFACQSGFYIPKTSALKM